MVWFNTLLTGGRHEPWRWIIPLYFPFIKGGINTPPFSKGRLRGISRYYFLTDFDRKGLRWG
jgi:hypothetical protein